MGRIMPAETCYHVATPLDQNGKHPAKYFDNGTKKTGPEPADSWIDLTYVLQLVLSGSVQ